MDVEEKRFPFTYEEVQGQWEGRLYNEYRLCEAGCGLKAREGHILCSWCLEKFRVSGVMSQPLEVRQDWMDAQRRRNILSPGEQTAVWRCWG